MKVLIPNPGSGWQIAYTWDGALWVMVDRSDVMEGKIGTASGKMVRLCLSVSVGGALLGRLKGVVTASDVVSIFVQEFPWSWLASFNKLLLFFMCNVVEAFWDVVIGINNFSLSITWGVEWISSLHAFLWTTRTKSYQENSCHWVVVAGIKQMPVTFIVISFWRAITQAQTSKLALQGWLC